MRRFQKRIYDLNKTKILNNLWYIVEFLCLALTPLSNCKHFGMSREFDWVETTIKPVWSGSQFGKNKA